MGCARAPVRIQRNRNFGDFGAEQARLEDHFGREFHSGAALLQPFEMGLGEAAQAAIDVVDLGVEPSLGDEGKKRIAEALMEHRHRARRDRSATRFQIGNLAPGRNLRAAC